MSIPNCDIKTAIEAFRRGLDKEPNLYKELTKYPCPTVEDSHAKSLAQIWLEEDMQSRKAFSKADNRKSATTKQSLWRPLWSSQHVNKVRHFEAVSDWKSDPALPCKFIEYGLCANASDIVNTLHYLRNTIKWPFRNEKVAPRREKSKWCEFHGWTWHRWMCCTKTRSGTPPQTRSLQRLANEKRKINCL